VYSEASILVTILVVARWQLSPRQMAKRLKRWEALAIACRYQPGQTVSASQLSRRRAQLGLWVYFFTFCTLVGCSSAVGIVGRDWVIDSTVIDAFSGRDSDLIKCLPL
jgi:hypothetical protein